MCLARGPQSSLRKHPHRPLPPTGDTSVRPACPPASLGLHGDSRCSHKPGDKCRTSLYFPLNGAAQGKVPEDEMGPLPASLLSSHPRPSLIMGCSRGPSLRPWSQSLITTTWAAPQSAPALLPPQAPIRNDRKDTRSPQRCGWQSSREEHVFPGGSRAGRHPPGRGPTPLPSKAPRPSSAMSLPGSHPVLFSPVLAGGPTAPSCPRRWTPHPASTQHRPRPPSIPLVL